MSIHKAVPQAIRRCGLVLLFSLPAAIPPPAYAQSVTDRLAQIQTSIAQLNANLNSFSSNVLTRLTAIADRLAPPTTPVPVSTGMEFKPADHFGVCRAVNVGSSAGNVLFRIMRSDGVELASTIYALQPEQGSTFSQVLNSPAARIWCRFEPQSVDMELRADLSISSPFTGLSVVSREAR